MVPSKFAFIDKMPLNQSGKLDRKALKNIDVTFDSVAVKEEPVTDNEKMICELFQKTLNIDFVGRNENFFNLGGTSLDMISILSQDELKEVSAAEFIANSSPVELAKKLDEKNIPNEYLELLWHAPKENKVLVLFPFAGGGAETYANFVATIKKSTDNISLYFVKYLHSENEYLKVAEEIQKDLQTKQIYFYSHCVGSAVALKILNILDMNGVCKIKHYIAGASIPAEKPVKWNSWNITPDFMLRNTLVKAGAPISKLSKAELKFMLKAFRNDTDFATQYFYKENERISCPISLVINKNDPFTTQYAKAELLWRRYSDNVCKTYYINPTSHYFQSDNSEVLVKIILEIMG